jgi:hypothetical protein
MGWEPSEQGGWRAYCHPGARGFDDDGGDGEGSLFEGLVDRGIRWFVGLQILAAAG